MTLLASQDGAVATLTLNRPDSLNALDVALKESLLGHLTELAGDDRVRAVVLAGAGRAFCVGQDLREHAESLASSAAPLDTVRVHYGPLVQALAGLPKPVVAAVRGMAAGAGAGLAFLADFRIGGPSTRFLTAFASIGLAADTGMSWTLPRLVGHARATELLMLSEPVGGEAAHRLGLLTELVDSDDAVAAAAQRLAARLADGPTVAYAQLKRELAGAASLADALEMEADAQAVSGATADHRNATEAFLAKRQPTFRGA
jgi:2-(1,2-epoxy-1,2-dihydrophenyl)acetyl-CoA isomerase